MSPINICHFFSIESSLRKFINETQGLNFLHNDLLQCYMRLAEGMGWEELYDNLVKAANGTAENQELILVANKYLKQIYTNKHYDTVPN